MLDTLPELTTKRLLLRKLEQSDASMILFLRSDERVNQYVKRPRSNTLEEATAFIQKIHGGIQEKVWLFWGIALKDNPELIGTICLWNFSKDQTMAEVGYDLHPEFQRMGIMNEALQCVLNFGFEILKLTTIEAYTHQKNEASKKLLMNNNFSHIEDKKDPENEDNIIFNVHRNSFKQLE